MTRILITGGAGFIGTNLVRRLGETDRPSIRILDNFSNPSGDLEKRADVEVIRGDVLDPGIVDQAMAGVDAVVHLAAHTRVVESMEDPVNNLRINVLGAVNVLEAMRHHGVKRIINASTGGAIVGDVPPPVHENLVPRPVSPYGASKLAVEGYLSAYAGRNGIEPLSLRFSNIYGTSSRNKGSVVAHFIKAIVRDRAITIYGDGTQTRDFLYVRDLCDGILSALQSRETGVMQMGSGKPTSVNELVAVLDEVLPMDFRVSRLDFRPGEVRHTHCDISLAVARLGFQPRIELTEGARLTWEWFRSASS